MTQPFIGEIRVFSFNFPPRGWTTCSGQILGIAQNTALFSLLGTTYGGNGVNTFALPDLRGRVILNKGQLTGGGNYTQGEVGGVEGVQLLQSQIPSHSHLFSANSGVGDAIPPTGNFLAGAKAGGNNAPQETYAAAGGPLVPLASTTLGQTGGTAHENMQPFLVTNYCIALQGRFPSRN